MAILATERVLTHNYWKQASKIEVGDYLFTQKGHPTRVTLVQHYYSEQCYKLNLSGHLSVSGDIKMAFPTENSHYRKRSDLYKGTRKIKRRLKPISIAELQELPLMIGDGMYAYSIPTGHPLELPHQDHLVPPFVFGFWYDSRLGKKNVGLPSSHRDAVIEKLKDQGYNVKRYRCPIGHTPIDSIVPSIEGQLATRNPSYIPDNYLLGSKEQRLALLSGLMYAKNGRYYRLTDRFNVSTKIYHHARQVQGLAESLGIATVLSYRESTKQYRLSFRSKLKLVDHQVSPKLKVDIARRYIWGTEPIQSQMCVHIETDGEEKNFLVGEGFIACL